MNEKLTIEKLAQSRRPMTQLSQRSIFLDAIEEQDQRRRSEYLDSVCGDDEELRKNIDALIAAHEDPINPLDVLSRKNAPPELAALDLTQSYAAINPSENITLTIDEYQLIEQIGEGGFGLVYLAQQTQPIKRKVALKIIKPGSGTKEVLARFDAERQAVALMDHPNIAQVFDAGVTADKRPYFVMELVRGIPITDFCEKHQLTIKQRIELFNDVCSAVQHAHQKGVIHRDLKPSNVMVTMTDERPLVKVIDFGVAKAIGQTLTDKTIYTRMFSMIGTPLYMSPEQAEVSGLDIDTRSDIYSLGVILYELLTGTTPIDRTRLDSANFDELRRMIRDEEPPKPSTRLITIHHGRSKTSLATGGIATARPTQLESRKSRSAIPSDLDWIVMKALDKDRRRRFESAAALSADLHRFLNEEPIEARPPSRSYRLNKFVRRNRVVLLTASLVATALTVGAAVSLYQASRAIAERNDKEVALQEAIIARNAATEARMVNENFTERLKSANLLAANARMFEESHQVGEADAAYSQAINLVQNYFLVWVQRAELRAKLCLWEQAASDFSRAMKLEAPVNGREWQGTGALFAIANRPEDYAMLYERLMPPADTEDTPMSWQAIRACVVSPNDGDDAARLIEQVELLLANSNRGYERPPDGGPPPPPMNDRWRGFSELFGPRQNDGPNDRAVPNFADGGERRGGGPNGQRGNRPGSELGPMAFDRLPWNIKQIIAAWANVRGGEYERALEHLKQAQQDRGPNTESAYALAAIANQKLDRKEMANEALKQANTELQRTLSTLGADDAPPRPWFDLVESLLLHAEATKVVTGQSPRIDEQLVEYQALSLQLIQP